MPRDGGVLKRLTVVGIAAAAVLVPASQAAASPVTLWACHGPSGVGVGQAVNNPAANTSPAFASFSGGSASATAFGDGCAGVNAPGGVTLGLVNAAAGKQEAKLQLRVPPNTTLQQVTLARATHGFGAAQSRTPNPTNYVARTQNTVLESLSLSQGGPDLTGSKTFAVTSPADSGESVGLTLSCDQAQACPSSPYGATSVDVSGASLVVDDSAKPYAAIGGWSNPAAGTLRLEVSATDVGIGLASAEAALDGNRASKVSFASARCTELSPADATVDLPIDEDCPEVGKVFLPVDTTGVADGTHTLTVTVYDAAGNSYVKSDTVSVLNHVDLGQSSQSLTIGTSIPTVTGAGNSTSTVGSKGGVAGVTSNFCTSPKLSMFLSEKPLRVSHGVPVLAANKRYRFNGRLTCVISGKRKSAPKRTRIDLLNVIGKNTTLKSGSSVRDQGSITILLAYPSSRTLVFRFVNSEGKRADVKIKVLVAKAKKK